MLAAIMHGMSRLSKKGKKIDYPEKPFLREHAENRAEEYLTEKEKKSEREKLLMTLQLMNINFDNKHKKD